ncbi:peptidase inhibitor family I36 protein [Umezawaea beigongshangensis]|uniref:peptidase inhibitor family I36 protein n=1 Tax=Umezawaea beigongshangensis TaxID=2780383 RepID=UPI0018F19B6D|nr:peptidase inhibitor family I36 protein [Umezawaea beigongshangensis]
MTTFRTRFVRAATAVAGAAALVLAGATAASAATPRNGICEPGEFCLYYLDDFGGSLSDFTTSISNYGASQPSCYDFKSAGTGQGLCVKNDARSAWNRSSRSVRVYFNSNYGGTYDTFAPGTSGNLTNTYDNNASHKFL